jgi:hypothetical protein
MLDSDETPGEINIFYYNAKGFRDATSQVK